MTQSRTAALQVALLRSHLVFSLFSGGWSGWGLASEIASTQNLSCGLTAHSTLMPAASNLSTAATAASNADGLTRSFDARGRANIGHALENTNHARREGAVAISAAK